MLALLVVADERAIGVVPDLDGFVIKRITLPQAAAHLAKVSYDAVVAHVGQDTHAAMNMIRVLDDLVESAHIPLFIAIDEPTKATATLMRTVLSEGLVDLRWAAELLSATIAAAVRTIRSRHTALEAQDAYLHAALGQAEHFETLAYRDDLTLLANRRYFQHVIAKEHARCERFNHNYALVFVDLDNLKQVNLDHGHIVGGQVLEEVGKFIHALTRKCDFAFRFGGDEFVVLLVDTNKSSGMTYAERLCAGVRGMKVAVNGEFVQVSASAGVAAFPEDGHAAETVLRKADAAVFAAKKRGKGCVVPYHPSMEPLKET